MIEKIKSSKGITMLVLAMTIVIMLILAAVAISSSVGDDGLINTATEATDDYENSVEGENGDFSEVENKMKQIKGKHDVTNVIK